MNGAETDGNGHAGSAARRALKLDASVLALVAQERGVSAEQLLVKLTGIVVSAGLAGDANAAREARGHFVATWLGHGGTDSTSMFKRIRAGMRRGILTLDEAAKATRLVQVKRDLETSDLDRRLRAVEAVAGTVVRTREDEEDAA